MGSGKTYQCKPASFDNLGRPCTQAHLVFEFRYKKHIHLLVEDNYKYKFLDGCLQYMKPQLHKEYFYIKVGILFLKMKQWDNHTFHLRNIQN